MRAVSAIVICLVFESIPAVSLAQSDDLAIKIFGYFQSSFAHETSQPYELAQNSFNTQQLNLFFQTDVAEKWRAFVNFEFLNNFSSSRVWGAANLEEAWIRYRHNERFSLKLGLQIPTFNHLNEIKNRTPLLPYVIRPLVYETSFSEFIAVEEFAPGRAFVQAYGFLPLNNTKFDYAIYVGNSPNVNSDPRQGQTGVDTTATFLVGGRVGVRVGELKFGVSTTRDNVTFTQGDEVIVGSIGPIELTELNEVPRVRWGLDLSYHRGPWSFESEFISVDYSDDAPNVSIDKLFYYSTLGYRINDTFLVYASYWLTRQDFTVYIPEFNPVDYSIVQSDIRVPTVGFSYSVNDRITVKGQVAHALLEEEVKAAGARDEVDFFHFSTAISVFF